MGHDGDRLQNFHLENRSADAAHGVDYFDLIGSRVSGRYIFNQQCRAAALVKRILSIPVIRQRLGAACAGLKFQRAADQDRLILDLPRQLGYHADVELGLPASHAAGFILHRNLIQPPVALLHDADFKYRAIRSLDRAASVVPLVSQRAGASGAHDKPRGGALAHRQVFQLFCDLHRQHHHQRCGGALDCAATVGDQHGVVGLIRNRDALQLQFRLRRALQKQSVLEPLVSQRPAAAGDHAELYRLPLHHSLAGGCLHELRQRHDIQTRLAAPKHPHRVADLRPIAPRVGQAQAFQFQHRAVGSLEQRIVLEPAVGYRSAAADLHAELGTPPDHRHDGLQIGHQYQRKIDRQQRRITVCFARFVANPQAVKTGAFAADLGQFQVRFGLPVDQFSVEIPLEEQRLRSRDGDFENRLAAFVHGLLKRLPRELRPLVHIQVSLAPHNVYLVPHLHGVQAFLQLANAAQHQFLPRFVRQCIALEKPLVREWPRARRLYIQYDIRPNSHGAILQPPDDFHRQVQRQPHRLTHELPAGVSQAHVVLATVHFLHGRQLKHQVVLPVDQFAVLVPFHLYRLGARGDQDKLMRVAEIDRRGIQPALEHRRVEHIQKGNLAPGFAEGVHDFDLVFPGVQQRNRLQFQHRFRCARYRRSVSVPLV